MLKSVTNYLDDFLFIMMTLILCNRMIEELGITVALNKTEWATTRLVFLGILLDCRFMKLAVPQEKRIKAIKMLENMLDAKKVKVGKLQTLCGYLNFLNKAIYPGRAFTRRMYAKFSDMVDVKRERLATKGVISSGKNTITSDWIKNLNLIAWSGYTS